MKTKTGEKFVGRFSVQFDLANYADILAVREKRLKPDQVRRMKVEGIVDSGAARFVLPRSVVQQLGLSVMSQTNVKYADGRIAKRDVAEAVQVELFGRDGTFRAIIEPKRETARIGAIILEDLDLLVDCPNEKLVPRDPRGVISEIE